MASEGVSWAGTLGKRDEEERNLWASLLYGRTWVTAGRGAVGETEGADGGNGAQE